MLKLFKNIILGLLLFFVTLTLTIFILFQIHSFRTWLLDYGISFAQKELNAKIEIDDFRLKLFSGIEVNNFRMLLEKDTIVKAEKLALDYNIFDFIRGNLNISLLSLENTSLKLSRSNTDSVWNYEKIAKPSPRPAVEDTSEAAGDFAMKVKYLAIKGLNLIYCDSVSMQKNNSILTNANIKNLNLEASAYIDLAKYSAALNLINLKLEEKNFNYKLEKLKLLAFIKDNTLELKDFKLSTNDINLSVNSEIQNFPLFSADSNFLQNAKISNFHLNINSSDFENFKSKFKFDFLPSFDKFDLSLNAGGSINDININKLKFASKSSKINFNGKIQNILDIENFSYSGNLTESTVNLNDLHPVPIPDKVEILENIEQVYLQSAKIFGTEHSLDADLVLSTKVGNLSGNLSLTFAPHFSYRGNINFNKLNLASLLKNKDLKSSLNGNVKLTGSGEHLDNLSASLELKLKQSEIFNLPIHQFFSNIKIQKPSLIIIDTLFAGFEQSAKLIDEFDTPKVPFFSFKGWLDLNDFDNPHYLAQVLFDDLNIAKYLGNDELPTRLDASIKAEASGWNLDDLQAEAKVDIGDCEFKDKSLMPFSIGLKFEKDTNEYRQISINSALFDIKASGQFDFNSIISIISLQGSYLADFFIDKFVMFEEKKPGQNQEKDAVKVPNFLPAKLSVSSQIKDFTIINTFLDDLRLISKADIQFCLDVSEQNSKILIDSIGVYNFKLESKDLEISAWDLRVKAELNLSIKDSAVKVSKFELFAEDKTQIVINDNLIKSPKVYFSLEKDKLLTQIAANYNNMIDISSSGAIDFFDDYFDIHLNNFNLSYLDTLSWANERPIEILLSKDEIEVKSFDLKRENAENIRISGMYKFESLDNIKIDIENFPLSTIGVFAPEQKELFTEMIAGSISKLSIALSGDTRSPIASLDLKSNPILFYKDSLGIISANLTNKNALLQGDIQLNQAQNGSLKNLFLATIHSLPLDIALEDVKERFHNRNAISISAESKQFPLSILSGFIPAIKSPVGSIDLDLKASGFSFTELNYLGKVKINPSSFLLEANNMFYSAEGDISIDYKSINIDQILLKNNPKDMRNGAATITGCLNHKDFNINDFNIAVKSKGVRLLSNASQRSMPTLYGDFDIATEKDSIVFSGTMQKPFLTGFASILYANLIMPILETNQMVEANVRYEYVGSNLKIHSVDFEETDKKPDYIEQETDFVNLMNYDLLVKFFGKMFLKMELGGIGQIIAEIGVKDRSKPLRVEMPSNEAPKLYEDIVIQENSSLSFIGKNFDISGTISFPSGSISNPGLDLKAIYNGKSYLDNVQRDFTVYLYLTGTKDYPNVKFDYVIDNVSAVGDSTTISEDALFLLLVGRTKHELSSGAQGQGNLISESVSSGASALFSKYFTEILSNTPLNIQSADLDLSGGSFEQARIKLTGRLFGNVYWRVGGTVADLTNNNEVSIDMPLPIVLHPELFNNIIIQLTKSTNTATIYNRSQKDWELKLKFGGSW